MIRQSRRLLRSQRITFTRTRLSLHNISPFTRPAHRFFSVSRKTFEDKETVTIHFIDQKGEKIDVQAPIGENILIVAHENNIDLEGACECSLACSTCHVYIDEEHYNMLPEPVEEEEDMLDLAYGLTPLSRLGCQVIVTKELEGMTVTLPKATDRKSVV